MSDNADDFIVDAVERADDAPREPSPALSIVSLVASIAAGVIGYFWNWPVGVLLAVVSIVTGILARRRRAPCRWAATLGIIVSVICLVICVVVVSIVLYQTQQMSSLLS